MKTYACFGPFGSIGFPVSGTNLKYRLEKAPNALVFQVLEQSSDITAFLKKYNFMASNGLRIGIDKYPEFKASKNAIFLQGSDTSENYKLDTTRFAGPGYRNNAAEMFNQALRELVDVVKGLRQSNVYNSYGYRPAFSGGNKLSTNKATVVIVD